MQNKGFVKLIASALALVCVFYISFSVVTSYYDGKADEYAAGDLKKKRIYLDSLANEKVFINYTLKECRQKEINLGLDLKGGMNVILELSVGDVLKSLSNVPEDEQFQAALKNADIRNGKGETDYIKIFVEEYQKVAPGKKLASIFSSEKLKEKVNYNSTDAQVVEILNTEFESAISNSFNVLRERIDRFGVVSPTIQRLSEPGRISIELPGVKDPKRVEGLLQGTANLQFWETYNMSEIQNGLVAANSAIAEIYKSKKQSTTAVTSDSTSIAVTDSVALAAERYAKSAQKDSVGAGDVGLFTFLQPAQQDGPVIGYAKASDREKIDSLLSVRAVKSQLPADLYLRWSVKAIDANETIYELIALKSSSRNGEPALTGDVVNQADADFGQNLQSSRSEVSMAMNAEGAREWARITRENKGRSIAIVLDNLVYSFPRVNDEITGGRSSISGNFTPEEAKDLANVLKSGKMAASVKIIQEDIVGPSLGQEAISSGMISFVIALVLLMTYMCLFYGVTSGMIANLALIINLFFTFGILASFQAVLTLSGIAGIVLSMGVAVDANVLIYERIKEELRNGSNIRKAIADGYNNAFSAIFDSNLTSIITAIILFYFGTGPIKGFATTLIIGLVSSFLTGVFITRIIYEGALNKGKFLNLTFTTKLSENFLTNTNIDFVSMRKKGYIVVAVFAVIFAGSLIYRGVNQGIDFTGGRNYVIQFEKPVNTQDIQEALRPSFEGASLSIITIGNDSKIRISTNYEILNPNPEIEDQILRKLYDGLKPYLPATETYELFLTNESSKQSSQKVGPAIASDITRGAIWAVLFSLVGMALYILIRFRNIAFSWGTIASAAHDAFFIIGTYSLLYGILPFSMEVDQSFIAAILTVIGYSMNDTVVIFDRIREISTNYPKRNLKELINEALNSTLSRTVNTSLSTLIVLFSIFILGGDTIRSFIFAMIVGVFIGVLSTIFVAIPVAYEVKKRQMKKLSPEATSK